MSVFRRTNKFVDRRDSVADLFEFLGRQTSFVAEDLQNLGRAFPSLFQIVETIDRVLTVLVGSLNFDLVELLRRRLGGDTHRFEEGPQEVDVASRFATSLIGRFPDFQQRSRHVVCRFKHLAHAVRQLDASLVARLACVRCPQGDVTHRVLAAEHRF